MNESPISGEQICEALRAVAQPEQIWILKDIETLAQAPARLLGHLWERVRRSPIEIRTRDLCEALSQAAQVISLEIHLSSPSSNYLLVEDGMVIECCLTPLDE